MKNASRPEEPPLNHSNSSFGPPSIIFCLILMALLVAILLPPLNGRHTAKVVYCLANLKSIALASNMYQSENAGMFPSAGDGTPRNEDWIYWQTSRDPKGGALVSYMGNLFVKKVYICPDVNISRPANIYQYSYTANVNILILNGSTIPGMPAEPVRYGEIKSPSTKILFVEEDNASIDDAAWEPQNWTPTGKTNVLATLHDKFQGDASGLGKGTASFADGHAELIERKEAMRPIFYDPWALR